VAAAAAVVAPAKTGSDLVSERAAAGRDVLAEVTPDRHAVQLMVTDAKSRGYLESYLADAGRILDREKLFLAPSGSAEAPRYAVLLGAFKDRADATAALDALPPPLRQFKPYVRSLEAVREDARRTERR
jgi:septal ring-binding cell division protein DamX